MASKRRSSTRDRCSACLLIKEVIGMSDGTKVRIALAETITKQIWVKGLITQPQREQIDKMSREKLLKKD